MENAFFDKEYYDQTFLHPLALAATIALGFATILLPRRYAVWPMIILACFIAPAQRIAIATLDFNLLRIMVLFGWARLLLHGEFKGLTWKWLDSAIITYVAVRSVTLVMRLGPGVIVSMLGEAFDLIGMYFLFRCLVRNWDDAKSVATGFAMVSLPIAVAFVIEHLTRHNWFSVFGGVKEITRERDGRLRCQGAFAHPILAGCFWATVLPLIAALYWQKGKKFLAVAGVSASLLVVLACASSTPVVAVLAALLAGGCFLIRGWMRWVQFGLLITLLVLHLFMNQPVWHLVSRIGIVGGSTAYYRFLLIDEAIKHIDEWWLMGTTAGTLHWGQGMYDITNYYIVQCLQGGLMFLLMFAALLALGFRAVGRMWRSVRADREKLIFAWALGVALFIHVINFLAVSYFGQIIMVWYLLLAMLGSLSPAEGKLAPASKRKQVRRQGFDVVFPERRVRVSPAA